MSLPIEPGAAIASTRPYLIRALHDWCTDNGYTPYLSVFVDGSVQVPPEYVKGGEIVLNIGFDATAGLQLGNEYIEFKARFGGVPRDIVVPVDHVLAIYARENGQGMAFPTPEAASAMRPSVSASSPATAELTPPPVLRLAEAGGGNSADKPSGATPRRRASDDEPTPPSSPTATPGGARPALKRIK